MSTTTIAYTSRPTTTRRGSTRGEGRRIAILEFTGEIHERAVVVPGIIPGMVRVHVDMVVEGRDGPGL